MLQIIVRTHKGDLYSRCQENDVKMLSKKDYNHYTHKQYQQSGGKGKTSTYSYLIPISENEAGSLACRTTRSKLNTNQIRMVQKAPQLPAGSNIGPPGSERGFIWQVMQAKITNAKQTIKMEISFKRIHSPGGNFLRKESTWPRHGFWRPKFPLSL